MALLKTVARAASTLKFQHFFLSGRFTYWLRATGH
jgi:hypothetical protein